MKNAHLRSDGQNHWHSAFGFSPYASLLAPQRISKGFTLVELLVALTIFSIMSIAAYRGLSTMLDVRARIETENHRWRNVAQFFTRMENDLNAFRKRPVRSTADLALPALTGSRSATGEDDAQLVFTRGGYSGQEGKLSSPQRVGYRLRQGQVEILAWEILDQAPRSRPMTYQALGDIAGFELRYLDRAGAWQSQWPLPGQATDTPPGALEVSLTLQSGEVVKRIFALP